MSSPRFETGIPHPPYNPAIGEAPVGAGILQILAYFVAVVKKSSCFLGFNQAPAVVRVNINIPEPIKTFVGQPLYPYELSAEQCSVPSFTDIEVREQVRTSVGIPLHALEVSADQCAPPSFVDLFVPSLVKTSAGIPLYPFEVSADQCALLAFVNLSSKTASSRFLDRLSSWVSPVNAIFNHYWPFLVAYTEIFSTQYRLLLLSVLSSMFCFAVAAYLVNSLPSGHYSYVRLPLWNHAMVMTVLPRAIRNFLANTMTRHGDSELQILAKRLGTLERDGQAKDEQIRELKSELNRLVSNNGARIATLEESRFMTEQELKAFSDLIDGKLAAFNKQGWKIINRHAKRIDHLRKDMHHLGKQVAEKEASVAKTLTRLDKGVHFLLTVFVKEHAEESEDESVGPFDDERDVHTDFEGYYNEKGVFFK